MTLDESRRAFLRTLRAQVIDRTVRATYHAACAIGAAAEGQDQVLVLAELAYARRLMGSGGEP
jgi:hypothetical protein